MTRATRRRISMMFFVVALGASAVAPAHAQEGANSPEMKEAEKRFEEGLALYAQGNINEARVKLVQAYAVLGRTSILWNLAVAEFYSNRTLESLRHMRQFTKARDADPNDIALAKKQFIPALEKQTGRVVVTAPKGSTIAVDGQDVGAAPLDAPIDVLPGRHTLVARGASGDATVAIDVTAGQTVPAKLGNDAASAPSGERAAERAPMAKTVTVIGLGAGALVAAGVGTALLVSSSSSDDDAKAIANQFGNDPTACTGSTNPDCARLREANDARDRDAALGTGFFIGAGALAIGAGLAFFLWPGASSGAVKTGAHLPGARAPWWTHVRLTQRALGGTVSLSGTF
jgi:PEGA domain-containing protein